MIKMLIKNKMSKMQKYVEKAKYCVKIILVDVCVEKLKMSLIPTFTEV